MIVEKPKITATAIVMRSRFFSATVDPAAAEPMLEPNMSESPLPRPLCRRISSTSARRQHLDDDDDVSQQHRRTSRFCSIMTAG